jgi:hypothetical protein
MALTKATLIDLNANELILDLDADTSITADSDDTIDFRIGGSEHISLNNSSGDTVIKPMVDGKDIVFQQYDGNKILEINDGNYVAISGAAAGPGELRFYEDTDLGTNYTGLKAGNATASVSYVLPLADGTDGYALTTDGSGTLGWSAMSANTPSSADGQALGSASLEWSDLFLADGAVVNFGYNQEITLTHVADVGLTLTHTAAGDNTPIIFNLKSEEDDIIADEVIGTINFTAGDSGGTDAILTAAGISAIAEDTFAADNNATKLSFKTAAKVSSAIADIPAAVRIASVPPESPAVKLIVPMTSSAIISSSSDFKLNIIGVLSPAAVCVNVNPTSAT